MSIETKGKLSPFHVAVAAEAFAAALFARCGYDVSVQYGANQPEYDLVVIRDDCALKISVKGSQDGAWGLTQSYLKNANYHEAIDIWRARHKGRTVFCFVQLCDVDVAQLPRVYLATPDEVSTQLKRTAKGRGDTMLYERKKWTHRAQAAGTIDAIPDSWRFCPERIKEMLIRA